MKRIPLLSNMTMILKAEEEAKELLSYKTVSDFLAEHSACDNICNNVPALYEILVKQHSLGLLLQSCIIYETVLIATLAYSMQLELQPEHNEHNIRFIYTDGTNSIYQKGNPGEHDCVLNYNNETYSLEIKKPLARAGDGDIKTDVNGYLIGRPTFPEGLNNFLHSINVLEYKGHNVPITQEDAVVMAQDYFADVDYIMSTTQQGNYLIIGSVNDIIPHLSYRGSEIRTTGKNWVKTKTLADYLVNYITSNGGSVVNGIAKIPVVLFQDRTKQRGGTELSKWRKIDTYFRLKDTYIQAEDNQYVECLFKDIEQTNPNVSVHITMTIPEV